jgi:glutamate N-acetyltransferase / amino-acid N-acetyltransferase
VEGVETLVMSTGVIGQTLPIAKIIHGIRSQSPSPSHAAHVMIALTELLYASHFQSYQSYQAFPTTALRSDFAAWERAAKAFMTTPSPNCARGRSSLAGGSTGRRGWTSGRG